MLETYFLDDYLGYIFLHKELSKREEILLDSLGENQCFFLNEALEQNYIFSNDKKYKDWVNQW